MPETRQRPRSGRDRPAPFPAILLGAALAATGCTGVASPRPPGYAPHAAATPFDPRVPRELERRLRMEAHQRAARARPPGAAVPPPPGFIRIPVETRRPPPGGEAGSPAKPIFLPQAPPDGSRAPSGDRDRRILPLSSPPPPACPTSLPFPDPNGLMPPMKTASIVKIFADLSWHICLTDMGPKGLWVGPVELQRDNAGPWMPVLYRAGIADIFVAYHDSGNRYYDQGGNETRALSVIDIQDTGPQGFPFQLANETFPTIAYEIRDRGPGWLCKGDAYWSSRRSQELILWAVSDAGNYDNIIEFGFRDDGAMTFRTGNTGYNSVGAPTESHSHDALWYLDADLNGWDNDSAAVLDHVESPASANPGLAVDLEIPVAREGAFTFGSYNSTRSFAMYDSQTNFYGARWGYELSPIQSLPIRHYGADEIWSTSDIYVTRYHYADTLWASPLANHQSPDKYLLPALNNEPTLGRDLVHWVKTAVHHQPTSEDLGPVQFIGNLAGVTLTHWSGFKLEPRNLFPTNPLGAPPRCGS